MRKLVFCCILVLVLPLALPADAHQTDRRTTASWYHAAGLTGGCGETMGTRSAASKWFGCGDRVMVVLPTGAHVMVTIDDRCHCGMDLDYSAAQSIGITGTARVAVAKVHPGWRQENSFASKWIKRG